jgi:hypothetical protein
MQGLRFADIEKTWCQALSTKSSCKFPKNAPRQVTVAFCDVDTKLIEYSLY